MQFNKHFAVLDLGSYNFHLLTAEFNGHRLQAVFECKHITELAAGLNSKGLLSASTINKALFAIKEIAPHIEKIPVQQRRVFGTGALRQAKNSADFIHAAAQILNTPIEVISGEQEAELVFLGSCYDQQLSSPTLIIDIGGGSTEFIIGQTKPSFLQSVAVGGLSFAWKYFPEGRVSQAGYQQALHIARQALSATCQQLKTLAWQQAIGASGIIRSIEAVLADQLQQAISLSALEQLAQQLINKGNCDHIRCPESSSVRPSVIPGGLVLLHAILLELDALELHTTQRSIREGAIVNLYRSQASL